MWDDDSRIRSVRLLHFAAALRGFLTVSRGDVPGCCAQVRLLGRHGGLSRVWGAAPVPVYGNGDVIAAE
jgi:hypothetical protein